MSDLQTKANGAKTVTPSKITDKAKNGEISKVDVKTIKIETTAEKRIKNLDNFQKLCQKHNFLKTKSDQLSSYLIGRDGLKETIIIENTDGQTFEISNSHIIGKILVICQDELLTLLEKSETEVMEYKI